MATRPRTTPTRRPSASPAATKAAKATAPSKAVKASPAAPAAPAAPAPASAVSVDATPTPAAPRRRTGAVRRSKAAVPPIAAAPEVHVAAALAPLDERIRVRAYYLHLERKGRPADPVADWLRAQRELAGGNADA